MYLAYLYTAHRNYYNCNDEFEIKFNNIYVKL
jgi:hypothetical protein